MDYRRARQGHGAGRQLSMEFLKSFNGRVLLSYGDRGVINCCPRRSFIPSKGCCCPYTVAHAPSPRRDFFQTLSLSRSLLKPNSQSDGAEGPTPGATAELTAGLAGSSAVGTLSSQGHSRFLRGVAIFPSCPDSNRYFMRGWEGGGLCFDLNLLRMKVHYKLAFHSHKISAAL